MKPLDDGAKGKGMQCTQVQIKHFTRGGSEHGSNVYNSLLGMYFAPLGFLNPNKDGSAHLKKDFSYIIEDNHQGFKGL